MTWAGRAVQVAGAAVCRRSVTYRLTADQLDALLAEAGLDHARLVPRRSRVRPARR